MGIQRGSKLNQFLKSWPPGTVSVNPWLEEKGIDRQLIQKYKKSDWVTAVGPGAIARSGDKVDWPGGIYALQTQLGLPVDSAQIN